MTTWFNCIYKNSAQDRAYLTTYLTAEEIVDLADRELRKTGRSFEDLAGIAWHESAEGDFIADRDLSDQERFELACKKLADNGRYFRAYNALDVIELLTYQGDCHAKRIDPVG